MKARIKSLQGLKAVLIIYVFLFHILGIVDMRTVLHGFFVNSGWMGVKGFFLLSGFLLGVLYIDNGSVYQAIKDRIRAFLRKYYKWHLLFFVIMLSFMLLKVKNSEISFWRFVVYAVSNLTLTHGQIPLEGCALAFNDVSWYLSTYMFLVLPSVLFLNTVKKTDAKKCCVILMFLVLFELFVIFSVYYSSVTGWIVGWWLYYPFPIRMIDVFTGILCGKLYKNKHIGIRTRTDNVISALCALAMIGIQLNSSNIPIYFRYSCIYTIPLLCIIVAAANQQTIIAKILSARPLKWIGDISFYIYISHLAIGKYVFKLAHHVLRFDFDKSYVTSVLYVAFVFSLTLIIATCMNRLDKRRRKHEVLHNNS